MAQDRPYKKFSYQELAFFLFLLIVCVVGTIGIFWFVVGMENGNRIMQAFMRSLLDNAVAIVVVLLLFNIFLVLYYSKKR